MEERRERGRDRVREKEREEREGNKERERQRDRKRNTKIERESNLYRTIIFIFINCQPKAFNFIIMGGENLYNMYIIYPCTNYLSLYNVYILNFEPFAALYHPPFIRLFYES